MKHRTWRSAVVATALVLAAGPSGAFDIRDEPTSIVVDEATLTRLSGTPGFFQARCSGTRVNIPDVGIVNIVLTRDGPACCCRFLDANGLVDPKCNPPPPAPQPGIDCDVDGVPDNNDNCPADPNPNQGDSDRDGLGDACDALSDACPDDPNKTEPGFCGCGVPEDGDGDGLNDCNGSDRCPGSTPDGIALNPNQYAQNDVDGAFEVGPSNQDSSVYTLTRTQGCTCRQIVEQLGKGQGHLKKGCSPSVMEEFTGIGSQPDRGSP